MKRLVVPSSRFLLSHKSPIQLQCFVRCTSSSSKPPTETPIDKQPTENDNNNLQKTLAATRAYLSKVQLDLKPHIDPYVNKLSHAQQQLKRLTADVSDSKEALARASKALNELTGYDQINTLKQKVNHQASIFEQTRDQVQNAKQAYEAAIETRSNTQRGINELLQRKHLWTAEDVTKFTELYRLEHAHSHSEAIAKEAYTMREKQMDREYMELARSIMERYHEEQLWSDKIRSVSTYGTWALMVVNLMLFVAVQTIFEPRKRQKLTDRFEELLVAKVDEGEQKFASVVQGFAEKDQVLMRQQLVLMQSVNQLTDHPLFDQETVDSLKMLSTQPMFPSAKEEDEVIHKHSLSDEELGKLLLLSPLSSFEETPIIKSDDTISLNKKELILYSIESAIAGGLATALAVYFFK